RFAKHDKAKYPDIVTANENGTPYYTNSSHLPVGYTDDIFSALDIQDELQTLYTSGTVFHAFIGEKLPDWKSAAALVRKIAETYRLPYYTLSPTYSVCREHGYIAGEQFSCPHCGAKTEVYSRITGYYRPVQNWNDGKSQEFKDRKVYDAASSMKRIGGDSYGFALNGVPTVSEVPMAADSEPENAGKVEAPAVSSDATFVLFATKTCPNCKMAKLFLDKAGIPYTVILADEEPARAQEYGVKNAPTLIAMSGSGMERIVNVSNIKRFAETFGKAN
ncbi:MAG: ribonucleoside triphosphate reductase, partial [Clostridia bacterium]|nr:ribonucleoside triphosphate reductase [Clostridia bacterium]